MTAQVLRRVQRGEELALGSESCGRLRDRHPGWQEGLDLRVQLRVRRDSLSNRRPMLRLTGGRSQ